MIVHTWKSFRKSWDLELAAMLSPFLVLRGFSEELCKFWILELAAMLSPFPILRIFEKLWLDLAAMFEFEPSSRIFHDYGLAAMLSPSSSSYFFRGSSSRTNKGKEPVTDVPRRSTRSSNAAVQQAWEEVQYVERNLEECDSLNREEMRQRLIAFKDEEYYKIMRTVSTWSSFDRTISIMSLSSTCSKREDPPSWVKRTNVIKTGVFVGGPSGFAEKSPARMDILMPASGYQGSDHSSVDLRPVGLGIFKGDGSNWVGGAILKEAEIFDAVRAFRQTVVFSDEAFMAMLESFLSQTNTFVVTNGEIGFSLKELSAITGLPILGNLYEEFMPIDSILEEQSEEFRLLYFQLVAFYDFLKEKEGSKVRCSSWRSGSLLSSNFFDSGESSESTTQEARAKNPDSKKISVMRENLRVFFASTDAIHSDIELRRDLAVYLTYWPGEAVFTGGDGMHIRPHCIFRLVRWLSESGLLCFHQLGAAQDDDPFMIRLARGKPVSESLLSARLRIWRFWDVEMGQSSVKLSPGLRKKAFDFGVSRDSTRAGSGRHYSLTNAERSWLFNIRVGTMVYRRLLFVDIQPYVPSRFAMQLGISQGVVGAPSSKVKRFGGLQDGRNAWAFYSAEDTTALISYPELPTFRTAGFTKWFVESFSAYRGLSKKELNVKQSSGKGIGKSDGVR
ncbi:hypothetical protein AAC387_Pa12g0401 [Persea americana]